MIFSQIKTKYETVKLAILDLRRRKRMANLTRYAGTCDKLITPAELQAQRRQS